MIVKFVFAAFLVASAAFCANAQTAAPTPTAISASPVSLETILSEAEKQVAFYQETFKNLLATETKTFEDYDKNGKLEERTVVESNLIIYQSSKDEKTSSELRVVTKVNEKPIPDSQARADRFLAELQKTSTAAKEADKIEDESLRYDKNYRVSGFTLYAAFVLSAKLREFFEFKMLASETYKGREVFVLAYRQTKKSPLIAVNENNSDLKRVIAKFEIALPDDLKKYDRFLEGRLLIDRETFQLWREERRVVIQSPAPLVAQESVFEYAPSDFEILVPKKISFVENRLRKNSGDDFRAVKNTLVTFDYSKFRKTEVEVKIIDEP